MRAEGGRPCTVQCEKTVADTEQPIAAPAWPLYGTRPPLRDLCVFVCALCERLGEDFGQAQDTLRGQVHLGSAFRA